MTATQAGVCYVRMHLAPRAEGQAIGRTLPLSRFASRCQGMELGAPGAGCGQHERIAIPFP